MRLRAAALLLLALWAVKLLLAAQLPLFGDEAFYWLEAQQPALAYDDVPGLTPWLIAASTAVFGDHPLAVRAPFLLLAALSLGLMYRIGEAIGGRRCGGQVVVLASALPLFGWNGLLALPDVPLTLAVLLCLYAVQLGQAAPVSRAAPIWLAGGLLLGLNSHYRFAMPLLAAVLALLLVADGRALLRQPRWWLAALLGLGLGATPLLWQQAATGAAGFGFQFIERHPWSLQAEHLFDPLLQALLVTPILYLLLLACGLREWRAGHDPARRWLAVSGLILLLLYWGVGSFADSERSRLHWPLPGYLALLPLLACRAQTAAAGLRRWLHAGLGLALAAQVGVAGYLGLVWLDPGRLAGGPWYPHNFAGWSQAAALVRERLPPAAPAATPTLLAADNFMLAAQLQFALGERYQVFSLDHPLNHKHGRQGVLASLGRDEAALRRVRRAQPLWLLADQAAASFMQRPALVADWCRRFPHLQLQADRPLHRHQHRFWLLRDDPEQGGRCQPPVLAYLDPPRSGQDVSGYLLRAAGGIRAVRARSGDDGVELEYGHVVPGLETLFPATLDPAVPAVGFRGPLPAGIRSGDWLVIEVERSEGGWSEVAAIEVGAPR